MPVNHLNRQNMLCLLHDNSHLQYPIDQKLLFHDNYAASSRYLGGIRGEEGIGIKDSGINFHLYYPHKCIPFTGN